MKKYKNSLFYITTIGGFSALMYWVATNGLDLEFNRNIVIKTTTNSQWEEFVIAMSHNIHHPLAILL